MKYWDDHHQQLILDYYYAYTGITSGQTRNNIITELMPVLTYIAKTAMRLTNMPQDDEHLQNVMIKIVTHILPRLNEKKLQGALHYLYLSTRRYCINQQVLKKYYHEDIADNTDVVSADTTWNADYEINRDDIRREILDALDDKIEEHRIINKTSTIFLINLKEYLINNDFDPRGFNIYIQEKMNICSTTYSGLISRCGIRSKIFNEKLINN